MSQTQTLLARPQPRFSALTKAVVRAVFLARQRRALRELDDHILKDIGLTRAQAEREAAHPFWNAPTHWQR